MGSRKAVDRAWDSDALIGWLGRDPDKQEACHAVIRACERGEVRLVISTLALTEVVKLKKGHEPIPRSDQTKITRFFLQPYIVARNLDPATSELGREIVWDHGVHPRDSIHVATALRAHVGILETFDGGLLRHSELKVSGHEPLLIRQPTIDEEQLGMSFDAENSTPEHDNPDVR